MFPTAIASIQETLGVASNRLISLQFPENPKTRPSVDQPHADAEEPAEQTDRVSSPRR